MPNLLVVPVEEPDRILNTGAYGAGALVRLQTGATETGAFADVSGTGSTPTIPVVAGTRLYDGYDPNGISTSWYRTRYENVGGTRLSDWSPPFQVGPADPASYILCDMADVYQRIFGSATPPVNEKETLLDIAKGVSAEIESYTERWLAPRPSETYILSPAHTSRRLPMPRGIRTVTALGVATISQPTAGGVYTTVPLSSVVIGPSALEASPGWPATRIELLDTSGLLFWVGQNSVSLTGATGWANTPWEIAEVAISAITRRYIGKESAATVVGVGPTGGVRLLSDISPAMQATLNRYCVRPRRR